MSRNRCKGPPGGQPKLGLKTHSRRMNRRTASRRFFGSTRGPPSLTRQMHIRRSRFSLLCNRGESLPLWPAACGGAAQVPGSVAHKANLFGAVKFQLLLLFSARCLRYAASLAFSLALASRTCSRVMDFSKPQLLYRASDKASSGRVPPAEFSGWATSIDRAATSLLSPGSGSMAATFGATSSIAVQASYSWKNRRCWGVFRCHAQIGDPAARCALLCR